MSVVIAGRNARNGAGKDLSKLERAREREACVFQLCFGVEAVVRRVARREARAVGQQSVCLPLHLPCASRLTLPLTP